MQFVFYSDIIQSDRNINKTCNFENNTVFNDYSISCISLLFPQNFFLKISITAIQSKTLHILL